MGFQSTSELAGGGQIYAPAMLKYNGTTNYQTGTFTPTGNKITEVLRFQVDSFLDATEQYRYIHRVVHNTYQRGSILVYPSDHLTVPNKLVCIVRDSTNTTLCYLVSTIDVCDGEVHNVLFAYDGDTGAATLIVDGQDVMDTGHVSHVLISGTIGTISTDFIVGAYLPGPSNEFNGSHGFAGMSETYISDYNAFFTPDNQPIFQDTSDWASTGWGAQPRYWNPHGDFRNNLGSEGNATAFGQLLVGDGFEFPPHRGIATIASAVPADIAYPKSAWVNGTKITGTNALEQAYPITNPNADAGTTGWTIDLALNTRSNVIGPTGYTFDGATSVNAGAYQDITAAAGMITTAMIDAGQVVVVLRYRHSSFSGSDQAAAHLKFFNGSPGTEIAPVGLVPTTIAGPASPSYWEREQWYVLPVGTRTIRLVMRMTRTAGTDNNGYMSGFSLNAMVLNQLP